MINPIHLEKGKLIDAHPGFVETWNWLVDSMKNLKGDGTNINVAWDTATTPVVRYTASSQANVDDLPDPEPIEPIEPLDISGLLDLARDVTVVGTSGSETGKTIKFETETDSNVTATVSKDASGNIIVKLGVYYQ